MNAEDKAQLAALREELAKQTYKAELYDEVWPKATGMGFMNITMALAEIPRLQQRLADAERLLTRAVLGVDRLSVTPEKYNSARWEDLHAVVEDINAAINKPEEAKS